MTELVKYEAARLALAAAVAVDEVQEIRSKAEAMRVYARQAGDRDLEIQAAQIRFRAERRLGEMLVAAKDAGQISRGQPPKNPTETAEYSEPAITRVTLKEAGIDHKLSAKAQKVAAMDAAEFEHAMARHAEEMRSGHGRVAMDLLKIDQEEKGRAHRRDLAQALSTTSVLLPGGRRYPAAYIDCPWKREGGIGDRAYENHYPTMSWPEILAFLREARDSLLPDAWVFFWIPRAHLLAPIEVEREVMVSATGELTLAKLDVPLAAACAQALEADYSTCFVWTKTDVDHPDVSGSGLIAWDQDELLLLFKRGRGLPKPAGSEKFGSNHRERPREHSRKPDFYREMIATMVGCDRTGEPLPVLEMFARVDAEHPLPRNWDACGNQARSLPSLSDTGIQDDERHSTTNPIGKADAAGSTTTRQQILKCASAAEDAPHDLPFAPAPSEGETVAAAVGSQGAAVATDDSCPAFPKTELADLCAYRDQDGSVARLNHPEYLRRGLIHDWLGKWRVTPQGEIRINVLMRELADREAIFKAKLEQQDFWDWRDLEAVSSRMPLDNLTVRSLIGLDLAFIAADETVELTDAGRARLAELEALVDQGAPAIPPATPYQLDLEKYLQGAP